MACIKNGISYSCRQISRVCQALEMLRNGLDIVVSISSGDIFCNHS